MHLVRKIIFVLLANTCATSGAETVYPSGAPEFTPVFSRVSCCSIFSFSIVDRCFSFSFGHCVVCPSNYWFLLPLWYLQSLFLTLLFTTRLSDLSYFRRVVFNPTIWYIPMLYTKDIHSCYNTSLQTIPTVMFWYLLRLLGKFLFWSSEVLIIRMLDF